MAYPVKMEILFGVTPVLLVSRLPDETVNKASCAFGQDGDFHLSLGGSVLASLKVPDYLRDRLAGLTEITMVEIENDEPVRKSSLAIRNAVRSRS
jgi:hypothetical protein